MQIVIAFQTRLKYTCLILTREDNKMTKLIGKWLNIKNTEYQILEDITDHKAQSLKIRYYARTALHHPDEASHIIQLDNGRITAIKL